MSERNDQMVAADQLPAKDAAGGVDRLIPSDDVDPLARMGAMFDVAIDRFGDAIDREVAEQLNDDEALTIRLARVRRADRSEDGPGHSDIDELAAYGYNMVRLWMRLVSTISKRKIGLAEDDVDEIAKETVARAINSTCDAPLLRDEIQRKQVLLAQCMDCLPPAYRSWRLKGGILEFEDLEELVPSAGAGETLIDGLRRCVVGRRQAARLMQAWGYTEQDISETLILTRMVLNLPPAVSA